MSVQRPTRFLTVDFATPIDIGLVPKDPTGDEGELLTVRWTAKVGTSYLPFDPESERVEGGVEGG